MIFSYTLKNPLPNNLTVYSCFLVLNQDNRGIPLLLQNAAVSDGKVWQIACLSKAEVVKNSRDSIRAKEVPLTIRNRLKVMDDFGHTFFSKLKILCWEWTVLKKIYIFFNDLNYSKDDLKPDSISLLSLPAISRCQQAYIYLYNKLRFLHNIAYDSSGQHTGGLEILLCTFKKNAPVLLSIFPAGSSTHHRHGRWFLCVSKYIAWSYRF